MTTARQTLPMRQEMAQLYPWITKLKRPRQCQSIGGTCKKPAYWRYRHSCRGMLFVFDIPPKYNRKAQTRYYCWRHMLNEGLYGGPIEYDRWRTWQENHEEQFNACMDKLEEICDGQ